MATKEYEAKFQLVACRIVETKIKNDFVTIDDEDANKKQLDISHEIIDVQENENGRVGILRLHTTLKISQSKAKYNMGIVYEGCFVSDKETDAETFEKLLNINGVTALYSITRAFVASTSAQVLHGGKIMLPMINVIEYTHLIDSKEKSKK